MRAEDELVERFDGRMRELYDQWRTHCRFQDAGGRWRPYVATRFLQGLRNHGGVKLAKRLLRASAAPSLGFLRLKACERLDLTLEHLVLHRSGRACSRWRNWRWRAGGWPRPGSGLPASWRETIFAEPVPRRGRFNSAGRVGPGVRRR